MCGIAGIFSFGSSAPPADRTELRAIRDHMVARDPDGNSEWFSDNGRVALGHRRLSIIDLTDRFTQIIVSTDSQFVITVNSEIYNYRELRKTLEAQGHVFRSDSDTEVLLLEKDQSMLQDLRGMLAFDLRDACKQVMLLARDAFGIKPLYYIPGRDSLRFVSQVKDLLASGQIDNTPEAAGHAGFVLWVSVPAPFTLYRGIHALQAGHCMLVGAQGAAAPQPFA